MQVSSSLKCPACDYAFSASIIAKLELRIFTQFVCPRCSNIFRVTKIKDDTFVISTDCAENGLRHKWNYKAMPGYALYKQCRRCRKEVGTPAQTKLHGFERLTT